MLRRLVETCLRQRRIVAVLALLALVFGGRAALVAPLDVLPEFVPPQVSVQTEAPGWSPEQVEALVTRPVEAAVAGAPGLESLRSESIPGLSVVNLGFAPDADVRAAREAVAERLAGLAGELPAGVGPPRPSPLTSSTMDLLKIGVVAAETAGEAPDRFALRDLAELELRPRLLAVPGVARVTLYGGASRQLEIHPRHDRLAAAGVTLGELEQAARSALTEEGAGLADQAAQQVVIEAPVPRPDPAELAAAVVARRGGAPILLGELAEVGEGEAPRVGDARIQGRPGVLLAISGQLGANTLATTRAVEAVLAELEPGLAARGVRVYSGLHRPANFIERALAGLGRALGLGALLILLVLALFLGDWRAALIAFLTIPLSLLAAVAALAAIGASIDIMTLGGFAVALGVLVDDAIIDLENIARRLGENSRLPAPRPRLAVMLEASLEIRGAVIYATAAVLLVFLPVLLAGGVEGRFLMPLARAFALAVLASLGVAFTVTPALAALLLPATARRRRPRWLAALEGLHQRLLGRMEGLFPAALAALLLLVAVAAAWLPFLGGELMPDFREGHFVMQVASRAPGTSLGEMLELGERISRDVLALPGVASVEQQVGRAELGEDTWGPHRSELHIELDPAAGVGEDVVQQRLREILTRYPAARGEVMTFLGDRISESLTGETAEVVIALYGERLEDLDRTGTAIVAALQGLPGIADLQQQREFDAPALAVELDRPALAAYGLQPAEALRALAIAQNGRQVGEAFDGIRRVPVLLVAPAAERSSLAALLQLKVEAPGGPLPLARVARLTPRAGRFSIRHEAGRRRGAVTFNVAGRALQATVDEARRRVAAAVQLPPGLTLVFAGEAEAETSTRRQLLGDSLLAAALIVAVLALAFRRRRFPWLVLAGVPYCLVGSVLALGLCGLSLSLGALVGLVTVFGVGARNAILLLAHYENLADREGAAWSRETLRRGARERLLPILMTALVTALGLVPLALGLGRPGHEIEGPMAVAVLGGLVSSTVLNLLLLPEMVWRWGGAPPALSAEGEEKPRSGRGGARGAQPTG